MRSVLKLEKMCTESTLNYLLDYGEIFESRDNETTIWPLSKRKQAFEIVTIHLLIYFTP